MKYWIAITLVCAALITLQFACSATEGQQFADDHPRFAPATQMVESMQRTIDPVAIKAQQGAAVVQNAADGAAALGVPGASTVALIAAAVGSILGVYNERRRGTIPLRTALEQVVQSVEDAFPAKTDLQKTAMSAAQDQSTRKLVSAIKGA
ncbi:MAG: hypothetical protein H7Z14_13140 [Anaerolineae bacterium]|nr:hypothetical protein [Phycisphaerae bacterium]